MSDEDAAADCVATAIEHFGGLDILVNNAGTNPAFGPPVEQYTYELHDVIKP